MTKTYEMTPQGEWTECAPEIRENTYALAEADAFRDMLRSALTKQVMDNTAILAKLEEQYDTIAPAGRNEYRFIVETYAKLSMARIAERGW